MALEQYISRLMAEAGALAFNKKRFGITLCHKYSEFDYVSDLREMYLRSIEREDECGICNEGYCCKEMLEEKIKTL